MVATVCALLSRGGSQWAMAGSAILHFSLVRMSVRISVLPVPSRGTGGGNKKAYDVTCVDGAHLFTVASVYAWEEDREGA